jgi:AAA domain, putative AbiEii toxin, Type IV TA system
MCPAGQRKQTQIRSTGLIVISSLVSGSSNVVFPVARPFNKARYGQSGAPQGSNSPCASWPSFSLSRSSSINSGSERRASASFLGESVFSTVNRSVIWEFLNKHALWLILIWLPKLSNGWFFRAESFFPVARYLDEAAIETNSAPPDFLSHSHGEGFLRLFAERCSKQGLYIFDEPESALSPSRQIELLKILRRISESKFCQVIMATHSPVLMACPDAHLLQLSKSGLTETTLYQKV